MIEQGLFLRSGFAGRRAILGATTLELRVTISDDKKSGKGAMYKDTNAKSFDLYGNIGISTLMAALPVDITLTRVEPTEAARRRSGKSDERDLYEIKNHKEPNARLYLSVPKEEEAGTYRLVVADAKNRVQQVILLEQVVLRRQLR